MLSTQTSDARQGGTSGQANIPGPNNRNATVGSFNMQCPKTSQANVGMASRSTISIAHQSIRRVNISSRGRGRGRGRGRRRHGDGNNTQFISNKRITYMSHAKFSQAKKNRSVGYGVFINGETREKIENIGLYVIYLLYFIMFLCLLMHNLYLYILYYTKVD